ncbi:MAG: hypothetical protein ABI561_22845 [Bradyrhizobium sp.]
MRSEFTKRAATFLAMVVAGYFLGTYLDQRFTSDDAYYQVASSNEATAITPAAAACVVKDGSWKNWSWPNVPTLSPKCDDDG